MKSKLIPALLLGVTLLSACAAPAPSTGAPKSTTVAGATSGAGAQTVSLAEYEALKKETGDTIDQLTDDVTRLEAENKALKKDTEVAPDNSAIAFKERLAGLLYFPVYELDADLNAAPAAYVAIKPQATVEEKLEQLTAGIAEILFADRAMALTAIEEVDGKRVARIDLKNADSWYQVFQGTTGGATASKALILSYLQADYTNAWIDGVAFTMDGAPLQMEHAPLLDEIQYRD